MPGSQHLGDEVESGGAQVLDFCSCLCSTLHMPYTHLQPVLLLEEMEAIKKMQHRGWKTKVGVVHASIA